MPFVKQRHAYGVEFTAPELIAASGRKSSTVRTYIRDAYGDMEEVCTRLGIMNADQLNDALRIVRNENKVDEQTDMAANEIMEILGYDVDAAACEIHGPDTDAPNTETDDDKGDNIMDTKDTVKAVETDNDIMNEALRLLMAYKCAVESVRCLSETLAEADPNVNGNFSNLMKQLSDLIEARCVNDYQHFVRMDWDSVGARVREMSV